MRGELCPRMGQAKGPHAGALSRTQRLPDHRISPPGYARARAPGCPGKSSGGAGNRTPVQCDGLGPASTLMSRGGRAPVSRHRGWISVAPRATTPNTQILVHRAPGQPCPRWLRRHPDGRGGAAKEGNHVSVVGCCEVVAGEIYMRLSPHGAPQGRLAHCRNLSPPFGAGPRAAPTPERLTNSPDPGPRRDDSGVSVVALGGPNRGFARANKRGHNAREWIFTRVW